MRYYCEESTTKFCKNITKFKGGKIILLLILGKLTLPSQLFPSLLKGFGILMFIGPCVIVIAED